MMRISFVGSGFWSITTLLAVGENISSFEDYEKRILIWVFEEMVNRRKLTMLINKTRMNVKYLPGVTLPNNVSASDSIREVVELSDIIFVITPVRFIESVCKQMIPYLKKNAHIVTCCKGFIYDSSNRSLKTVGQYFSEKTKLPYTVILTNRTSFLANNELVGKHIISGENSDMLAKLIKTKNTDIEIVEDSLSIEFILTLKSLILFGAGLVYGIKDDLSLRVKVLEVGIYEMKKLFVKFFPEINDGYIEKYGGLNDILKTTFAAKNFICAKEIGKRGASVGEVENMLNGQIIHALDISQALSSFLIANNSFDDFPFFKNVFEIISLKKPAKNIIKLFM